MPYNTRARKISRFTKGTAITDATQHSTVQNGINKTFTQDQILDNFASRYGASLRTYEFESQMVADSIRLGEYALVEENLYSLYKVTNLTPGDSDVTLSSGLTATLEAVLARGEYESMNDLINIPPLVLPVGTTLSITGEKVAGTFYLAEGVATSSRNGIQIRSSSYDSASRHWARIYDGEAARMYWFDPDGDGTGDDTDFLEAAAFHHDHVILDEGGDFLVTDIPTSISKLSGGGKLSYTTTSGFPGDVYSMDGDLSLDNVIIECRQRNRLAISADNIVLNNVVESLNSGDTASGAYQNVEWRAADTLQMTAHTCNNTGIKITETGDLNINGAIINLNGAGGGDGNDINDGTDAVKVSTGSGNIQNIVSRGCSRDVIDAFVSSGELNINNVRADGFDVNIIEIKIQDGQTASQSPNDINISNVVCESGGLQNSDNFAGLFIENAQTVYDPLTAPRRINVTNWNARGLGADQTSGQYYGAVIEGSFEVNLTNFNTSQVKDFGVNVSTDVTKLKMIGCNIHAETRALSLNGATDVEITNCVLGEDEETDDHSQFGIVNSGVTSNLKVIGGKVRGTTNSIRAESSTINEFRAVGATLMGAVRIDNSNMASFSDTDIFCHSSGVNSLASLGDIDDLKYIGGSIRDGSRGISRDNILRMNVQGVSFIDNNSVVFGASGSTNNIITGNISDGSGAFPGAAGSEVIDHNIVI